jgi:ribonuclease BN (tRNA processing enzyme)
MTTRIFRGTVWQVYGDEILGQAMKLRVVGCSPAWPNPGGAQSGYLIEGPGRLLLDCGPGVLARLREGNGVPWPRVDAIVVTHWHLDHWGDLVPWVWAAMVGPAKTVPQPELCLPPGGREHLRALGARLGREDMFEVSFKCRECAEAEPFSAAGLEVTAIRLPHYTLQTFGLRVSDGERVLAYSGDSAPSQQLAELARGADLFICEATLERGELDGELRGHLAADEAVAAFEASGAKRLLITHRPHELPLDGDLEQAYDGLELEV